MKIKTPWRFKLCNFFNFHNPLIFKIFKHQKNWFLNYTNSNFKAKKEKRHFIKIKIHNVKIKIPTQSSIMYNIIGLILKVESHFNSENASHDHNKNRTLKSCLWKFEKFGIVSFFALSHFITKEFCPYAFPKRPKHTKHIKSTSHMVISPILKSKARYMHEGQQTTGFQITNH